MVEIASKSNFLCQHKRSCHPNCLERQKRNCYRLMKAVRAVYGEEMFPKVRDEELEEKVRRFEAKTKRKVKEMQSEFLTMFLYVNLFMLIVVSER